jgi:phosphohistidine phosphatase
MPQSAYNQAMKLYLLRHGAADWPEWTGNDDERPLNEAGKKEMRRVAKFLMELGVAPSVILSSPLPRALKTAQIAHRQIGGELIEEAKLAPGATPQSVRALLEKRAADAIMLVGHEPDLSGLIHDFTGGHAKMPKAGLARIDLDESAIERGKGTLVWLLPPKISAR